jgi:hypothetical protein
MNEGFKKCGKCHEVFSLNFFFANKSRKTSNRPGVSSSCKRCHLKDEQIRYYKKRKILLDAYGGKCVECSISDIRVLCIDHVNGGGLKDMASFENLRKYFKSLLPVNLDKYQILCQNHNWKKRHTNEELHKHLPHFSVDENYVGPIKFCPSCSLTYKTTDFFSDIARKDGLSSYCKACHMEEGQNRKRTLAKFLASLPIEIHCAVCNTSDVQMLHLDHILGKGNLERNSFASYDAYIQYLESLTIEEFKIKYAVLCANHNAIKVYENKERYSLVDENPLFGKKAEQIKINSVPGRRAGTKFPNQKAKLAEWRAANPEAWAARNAKIAQSRRNKKGLF